MPRRRPADFSSVEHLRDALVLLQQGGGVGVVPLAVDRVELVGPVRGEHGHLLQQRAPDVGHQALVGPVLAEHRRHRVAVRLADQRHGVDDRAVQVQEDRIEAAHVPLTSGPGPSRSVTHVRSRLSISSMSVRSKCIGVTEIWDASMAAKSVPSSRWYEALLP